MANLRDIRRRIKSVKNTRQITRAMQLVSSSKMKRAQDSALAGRAYAHLLADLLNTVSEKLRLVGTEISHPYFQKREVKTRGIIVFSTDKGLCGPLNANLLRKIVVDVEGPAKFITVGRKATQAIARSGRELLADFSISDAAGFNEIRPLLRLALEAFEKGEIDTLELAYPRYVNVLLQEPIISKLLPVLDLDQMLAQIKEQTGSSEMAASAPDVREMLFEPSVNDILEGLPDLYVKIMAHQYLLEARASEHCARMVAMKAATDNASNLVDDLTLEYNKARQAAITQEILEIAAASAAD